MELINLGLILKIFFRGIICHSYGRGQFSARVEVERRGNFRLYNGTSGQHFINVSDKVLAV